ncbi:uncharacterized protein LOC123520239 [Portunus trituberculatus]|uniref:Uncharacterized protein n=1 Tax=Portunus trituberculatus TaxID=210409 RepID=A0A5B7FJZ7_PORTR|nr:uncharacterized protein LOC123520239 [Portunus trituberculatus]MPC47960.1 hypothetical protein [Portunus trituberculatus]
MEKYPNYKYRPKRKVRNLSTYQSRSCSQYPILLDLMEGFQPFLTTPQQAQQAQHVPERATHFQEELTRPLTSHHQSALSSSLDHRIDTQAHTLSPLNHSAHHESKFAGMRPPLYHQVLHQESLVKHCDALAGSSASPHVSPPTQYLAASFPFPNSKPTTNTFARPSQVHYPPPLNLVDNSNKAHKTDVFRPWESNSCKDEVSHFPGSNNLGM